MNSFPPENRIRKTAEFQVCYSAGARAGDDQLLLFGRFNGLDVTRLGVSVSKKHGNAVARNRRKRLIREAFRIEQNSLPSGMDLVVVPRRNPAPTLAGYRRSLSRLAARVLRRLQNSDGVNGRQSSKSDSKG